MLGDTLHNGSNTTEKFEFDSLFNPLTSLESLELESGVFLLMLFLGVKKPWGEWVGSATLNDVPKKVFPLNLP